MNMLEVDYEQYAEIVDTANILDTWNLPNGLTLHIAEHEGSDWFFVYDPMSGGALLIDSNDAAYGGSTHDHVRNAKRNGTL